MKATPLEDYETPCKSSFLRKEPRMNRFKWRGIPANLQDTRIEWISLVHIPLVFTTISVSAAIFFN